MKPSVLMLYAHGFPDQEGRNSADRRAFTVLDILAGEADVDLVCLLPLRHAHAHAPPATHARCRRLLAFASPASRAGGLARAAAAALAGRPIAAGLKRSPVARAAVRGLLETHRYAFAYAYSPLSWEAVPDRAPLPGPRITEVVEVLYDALRGYRASRARQLGWSVALQARQWRAMRRFERGVYAAARRVVCLSDEDAALVRALDPAIRTEVIPLAVDLDVFKPADAPPAPGAPEILYTGNFDHPPNVAAVLELGQTVLPAVRRHVPDARLLVVGKGAARMAPLLPGDTCRIVDDAPSLVPYYHRAALVAGPIRTGRGVRGKFLEALACGCPVVTTPLGACGIRTDPEDGIVVRDRPDELADAIARLLQDPADRAARAAQAAAAMRRHHGHAAHRAALLRLVAPLLNA